jgi:HD superfamily phosphohydrolase
VYESIELCPLTKVIIDTRHVQRLRMLEQLGCSYLTFMNATHKRYEHSLGVMHLGRLLCESISMKQPKLGITPKEIKCVSIAGLLHDLGHGPFSHNYELFLKLLDKALKSGSFLGYAFDTDGIYKGYRDVTDGWEHEDASLMMVDDLLRHLGLEIDETNLDAPLKQIGDGIDASLFGLYSTGDTAEDSDDEESDCQKRTTYPLPIDRVLTSRDWIFIKECIIGHPLPPKGMSIRKFKWSKLPKVMIGRPDPFKEFLYDIICNRHSGLDVDKMDYLMRDTLRCHGTNIVAHIVFRLIEKALVAWGECSNPLTCWKCQQNVNGSTRHLMM